MPKTIPHRELRNNSSDILRQVQSGETFNITNKGEVVAVITPVALRSTTQLPVRRARIFGGWDEIVITPAEPRVAVQETTQESLDYLRGDR